MNIIEIDLTFRNPYRDDRYCDIFPAQLTLWTDSVTVDELSLIERILRGHYPMKHDKRDELGEQRVQWMDWIEYAVGSFFFSQCPGNLFMHYANETRYDEHDSDLIRDGFKSLEGISQESDPQRHQERVLKYLEYVSQAEASRDISRVRGVKKRVYREALYELLRASRSVRLLVTTDPARIEAGELAGHREKPSRRTNLHPQVVQFEFMPYWRSSLHALVGGFGDSLSYESEKHADIVAEIMRSEKPNKEYSTRQFNTTTSLLAP